MGFWGHLFDFWYHLLGLGVICWGFGVLVDFYWGFVVILGVFGAICWLFVAIRRFVATPPPSASPPTELRALPSLRPPANCSGAHGGGAGGPGAGGGGLAGGAELRGHGWAFGVICWVLG